jgi:hypothetical protein
MVNKFVKNSQKQLNIVENGQKTGIVKKLAENSQKWPENWLRTSLQ